MTTIRRRIISVTITERWMFTWGSDSPQETNPAQDIHTVAVEFAVSTSSNIAESVDQRNGQRGSYLAIEAETAAVAI